MRIKPCNYHLDQGVRGKFYSKLDSQREFQKNVCDKFDLQTTEAILPLSLIEYSGINTRDIYDKINPVFQTLIPPWVKVKDFYDKEIENLLPQVDIENKLKSKQDHCIEYENSFVKECIKILPETYRLLISLLSWDRFSQMTWAQGCPEEELKKIRKKIGELISKHPHLHALRHSYYINQLPFEVRQEHHGFLKILKKSRIKPNKDIGDCELIHVAINGQCSSNLQTTKKTDCFVMNNDGGAKEIKRRIAGCSFYYSLLENHFLRYKFNTQNSGNIYVLEENGKTAEKIVVSDWCFSNEIMYKIKRRDLETLFLMND